MSLRLGRLFVPALAVVVFVTGPAARDRAPINTNGRGSVAISGYDPVAYGDGTPTRGAARFTYSWNGATWRFATAANRDRFAAEPERYAPQFGGYCAWAVSRGYTADVDPEAFSIVDGRLYLNYSKRVRRMWEQDIAGNIAKGRANWPAVLSK
jgi:YHS domain-containing protein